MLEKENEELRYKVDNIGHYDENRLKEFRNKTVIVPSTKKEISDRLKKTFIRNHGKMKILNQSLVNQ